jgi:hypothetical protein
MYYEDEEDTKHADPFAGFGELEEEAAPGRTQAQPGPTRIDTGFSWAGFAGGLAAIFWVFAAIGGPLSYFGAEALLRLQPAIQAGLVALALGPALLFWLGASAAGEALKARRLTAALARIAQQTPAAATLAQARQVSETVKREIETLNGAVTEALERLGELEQGAERNTQLVTETAAAARAETTAMTEALRRERTALSELNQEMREDTEALVLSVGRQVKLLREASKLAHSEMGATEQALEQHLADFAASAAALGQHRAVYSEAAEEANCVAAALNGQVASMLDSLAEATRLTDTARQAAEQAVAAANETAHAVREGTRGAVAEAKRAAQLVRAETQALQESAGETLARLAQAAQAARSASEQCHSAADQQARSIEKRLGALATAARNRKIPAARPSERATERHDAQIAANDSADVAALQASAGAAFSRRPPQRLASTRAEAAPTRAFKGFSGWNSFLPQDPPHAASNDDLVTFGAPRRDSDADLKCGALDLVAASGVDLDAVLAAADLDRIAQSSRHGAAARRRSVFAQAPRAVSRIARHVEKNTAAHQIAAQFRARPDLAKSPSKGEDCELMRAYLLIDAALA